MGAFGDRLKKEREQRGISLDDISVNTKIGTRLLRALEDEKFDQLPGGIFNKGFVRAYARHIGIDEEQAIADYMTAVGGNTPQPGVEAFPVQVPIERPPEPPPPAAKIHARREARKDARNVDKAAEIPWGLLAILLLLIALIFAGWSYYHREQRVDRNRTVEPTTVGADTPGELAPTSTPTLSPTGTRNSQFVVSPIPSKGSPSSAAQAVQKASSLSTAVPPGMFTVLLKGNNDAEECWVSIVVDGQPATETILSAPIEKLIQARNEVVVKAGSIGAIDVYFNGRKLQVEGGIGDVRTLTFRADGPQKPPPTPSSPSQ